MVVRTPRGAGEGEHREHVDATADAPRRPPLLDGDQPRGHSPPRCGRAPQQNCPLDRRTGLPRVLVAVRQRAAPRTRHRARRPPHVVFDRARHRHRTTPPRRRRRAHRRVLPRGRTVGPDLYRRPDRGRAADPADRDRTGPPGGIRVPDPADPRRRNRRDGGGLRRSDTRDRARVDARPHRPRPQRGLVRRAAALGFTHGDLAGRLAGPPIRRVRDAAVRRGLRDADPAQGRCPGPRSDRPAASSASCSRRCC